MNSLVIYATSSGNTKKVAEAIADGLRGLGSVQVLSVEGAPDILPLADLVVVGGPTERHTLTPPMDRFLDRVAPDSLRAKAAATFDTRLEWPRVLSGSAAADIGKRLRAMGARLVAKPESFRVSMEPRLRPGELARAAAWAVSVAAMARVPEATAS